jgi:hypothetical protein
MTNSKEIKIIKVVDQESALLEHIIYRYSFLFETKYKLANGEFNHVGKDLKKELNSIINRLTEAIE